MIYNILVILILFFNIYLKATLKGVLLVDLPKVGYSTINGSENITNQSNPSIISISNIINNYYYFSIPNKLDNSISIFKINHDGSFSHIQNYKDNNILNGPYMTLYSPNGLNLAVININEGSLVIFQINQNNGSIYNPIKYSSQDINNYIPLYIPAYMAYSPDSSSLAITDIQFNYLILINLDNNGYIKSFFIENSGLSNMARPTGVTYSKNGQYIAIANPVNTSITILELDQNKNIISRNNYILRFLSFPVYVNYLNNNKSNYIDNDIICITDQVSNCLFTVKYNKDGSLNNSYLSKFPNLLSQLSGNILTSPYITQFSYNNEFIIFSNTHSITGAFTNAIFIAELLKDGSFNNEFSTSVPTSTKNLNNPSSIFFTQNNYYSIVDDYNSGLFFITKYYLGYFYKISCKENNNKVYTYFSKNQIINNGIIPTTKIENVNNPNIAQATMGIVVEDKDYIIYKPFANVSGIDHFGFNLIDENNYKTQGHIYIFLEPFIKQIDISSKCNEIFKMSINNIINNYGCGTKIEYLGSLNNDIYYNIVYKPNVNFIGTDEFNYSVIDQNGQISTNKIIINVE